MTLCRCRQHTTISRHSIDASSMRCPSRVWIAHIWKSHDMPCMWQTWGLPPSPACLLHFSDKLWSVCLQGRKGFGVCAAMCASRGLQQTLMLCLSPVGWQAAGRRTACQSKQVIRAQKSNTLSTVFVIKCAMPLLAQHSRAACIEGSSTCSCEYTQNLMREQEQRTAARWNTISGNHICVTEHLQAV